MQDAEMPPHLANDTCRDYKYDTSLTDEQIQTIADWVEAGTPEGDPSVDPEPLPSASPELSEVDLRLGVPKPYKPRRSPDDYRCFPIDWPADEKKFVTGFGVDPDEREIAHHAIAYVLGPSLSDEVDQKAASEEGPGYTCFGGTKVGDLYPQGAVRWLGAWAPGNRGSDLPEGTGIPVKPGSTVVLQMHYNTLTADPRLDETEVLVNTDTSAETTGQYFPFTNPKWLQNEDAMKIPAGAPDVTHEWTFDVASYLGEPIKIHRAMLHMHKLGEAGRLWVDHSEGSEECLLGISNWDFDWQRTYSFQKPVSIQPGDEVGIQCTWDNTLSNQPVFNGQRQQPRDVSWGQGTTDEMCLGIFYVTLGK
ncbi:MAG: monooxygenase [Bradymonadaceae bacterium]